MFGHMRIFPESLVSVYTTPSTLGTNRLLTRTSEYTIVKKDSKMSLKMTSCRFCECCWSFSACIVIKLVMLEITKVLEQS